MDKAQGPSIFPRLFALAAIALAAYAVIAHTGVVDTDLAGVRMELPSHLGPWAGHEILFCSGRDCGHSFFTENLPLDPDGTPVDVCPDCGQPLATLNWAEQSILPADTGLTRRFALAFVTAKRNRGKPWRIMIMFFLAVILMGLVSTSSAICVLFMAIAEEMFNMTGYKKGDRLVEATMIGIFWMAQGAMAFTPISHVLIPAIFENILNDFGVTVTYGQFSALFILVGICFFLGWIVIFRFIIKPDVEKMADLDIDALKATLKPMSKEEWTVLVVYGLVIITWCFPDLIGMVPGLKPVAKWMSSLGSGVPPMVACAILCMIRYNNKPMLDYKDCCRRIPWGSVFMMTAVMGTAYIFGLESCGVTAWITQTMAPVMSKLSPAMFALIVIIFINVMTNCMSNTLVSSMYAVVVPLALTVAGVNPIAIALLVAAGCNSAFTLPSSCPAAGLASGAGWTRVSFQVRYGALLMVWQIILYFVVAYPLLLKFFPFAG